MNTQTNTVKSVDAKRSSARKNLVFTIDQLKQLHWIDGLSETQIGDMYGVSGAAINYWMKKFGLAGRHHVDNLLFEHSPALSYVLGAIIGDGCVYRQKKGNYTVRLHVCDKIFAKKFSDAVKLIGFEPGRLIFTKADKKEWRDRWLSCFYSNAFGNWYASMTLDERIDLGMKFPDAFVRGFYEAEGCLCRHHGRVELSISDTHADGAIIYAIQKNLPHGIVSHVFVGKKNGVNRYTLSITRSLDVRRFLAWTMPCIKTVPRAEDDNDYSIEADDTQANTEAILDRNAEAAVENTKAAQNGEQVGLRPAMDGVQPSGRSQPVRCIPTCVETHRAQQKCPAPGTTVTFL